MRLSSRGNAPEPLERAADRNNSARRSSRPLLDPHGIYGTRTATRVRAARRRQGLQSLTILALVGVGVAASLWWTRQQRVPSLRRLTSETVAGEVSAPATWNEGWTIPTSSGELVRVAQGKRMAFISDFALRAQPENAGDTAFAAGEDGSFFALKSDFSLRWKYRASAPISARPAVFAPAAVQLPFGTAQRAVPLVLVADDNGTTTALRVDSGTRLWTKKLGATAGDGLTLAPSGGALEGRAWIPLGAGEGGFEGGAACLDARNGRVLWRVALGAVSLPAPALDSAHNALFCVADNGAVFCLDARTGRKIWKTFAAPLVANSAEAVVLRGAPVVSADGARLFVGGNDGALRCFDGAKGTELWRFETGAPVRFPIALASGSETIWCANDSARLWALDAATGLPRWKIQTSSPPYGAPHIGANAVEIVTRDGRIETFALPH